MTRERSPAVTILQYLRLFNNRARRSIRSRDSRSRIMRAYGERDVADESRVIPPSLRVVFLHRVVAMLIRRIAQDYHSGIPKRATQVRASSTLRYFIAKSHGDLRPIKTDGGNSRHLIMQNALKRVCTLRPVK